MELLELLLLSLSVSIVLSSIFALVGVCSSSSRLYFVCKMSPKQSFLEPDPDELKFVNYFVLVWQQGKNTL